VSANLHGTYRELCAENSHFLNCVDAEAARLRRRGIIQRHSILDEQPAYGVATSLQALRDQPFAELAGFDAVRVAVLLAV
jgi:hypothetical protein